MSSLVDVPAIVLVCSYKQMISFRMRLASVVVCDHIHFNIIIFNAKYSNFKVSILFDLFRSILGIVCEIAKKKIFLNTDNFWRTFFRCSKLPKSTPQYTPFSCAITRIGSVASRFWYASHFTVVGALNSSECFVMFVQFVCN